jgi:hypothetical protein
MPSARDIAFVGCRLLALYVLVGVVQSLAIGVPFLLQALWGSEEATAQRLLDTSLQHASAVTGIALVAILWFGARWISGKVADGSPQATGQWSPRIALSLAVIFFGLYLLVWTLPYVSYLLQSLVNYGIVDMGNLASIFIQGGIGVGCILGAQSVADAIARLRRW